MKYVAYCSYHKNWMTQEELYNNPKCMHLDKSNIKKKTKLMSTADAKCKYLFLVEKETKE